MIDSLAAGDRKELSGHGHTRGQGKAGEGSLPARRSGCFRFIGCK